MSSDLMIETKLARAFSDVAGAVPDAPPSTWAEAKAIRGDLPAEDGDPIQLNRRRRSGRWLLSIGVVAGLAGAGTAAAAASGAFNGQANQVFKQFATRPEPAAWGRLPAFDPRKEILEVTNPGPEGTTVSVWTYAAFKGFVCVAVVDSKAGEPTFPGKGPGVGGGCSGGPPGQTSSNQAATPYLLRYGVTAGLWRSPKGNLYYLTAGNTPEGAVRVVLTFMNGTVKSVNVHNGWFGTGIPYDEWLRGFTGAFYGSSGQLLPGTLTNP